MRGHIWGAKCKPCAHHVYYVATQRKTRPVILTALKEEDSLPELAYYYLQLAGRFTR